MHSLFNNPPVLGFAGYSGSGKTTLLAALLPLCVQRSLRVGMIKHSHHDFEIDQPGKDSYRLRTAGAQQMLIASPYRTAWIQEQREKREPRLEDLLRKLDRSSLDLVLVEGFRRTVFPKIEVHRAATGKPLLYTGDDSIIAVACDEAIDTPLPLLDLNRPMDIVQFMLGFVNKGHIGTAV